MVILMSHNGQTMKDNGSTNQLARTYSQKNIFRHNYRVRGEFEILYAFEDILFYETIDFEKNSFSTYEIISFSLVIDYVRCRCLYIFILLVNR